MGGVPRNQGVAVSPLWFTISEVADVTGIDESTIRNEVRQNHLHPRRHGATAMIVDAELQRWLHVRFPSHEPVDGWRHLGQSPSGSEGSATRSGFSVEQWLDQTEYRKRQ